MGCLYHSLLQGISREEDARSIHVDNLKVVPIDYTTDTVSSGLFFGCNNRESLSNEYVHECRFTYVGLSNKSDKTGLML